MRPSQPRRGCIAGGFRLSVSAVIGESTDHRLPSAVDRSARHHSPCAPADDQRELSHTVYTDFREESRSAWDELALQSGGDIYSTYDWCRIWWRHYGHGRRLQIHVFARGGRWVACLPSFSEKLRLGHIALTAVRLVGCDHSVTTCQPTIQPGEESCVLRAWIAQIGSNVKPDVIQLGPLPGYGDSAESLAQSVEPFCGLAQETELSRPQMVVDVPDSYDRYLAQLPKKKRGELRREERDFALIPGASIRVVDAPQEFEGEFGRFVDLHQTYWQADRRLGHFGDWPQSREFHQEMIRAQSAAGRAILIMIESGSQLLAAEYCYGFGSRLHWFLSARRRDFSGRVGFSSMMREAIARGATQLDAMRGYYDYKKWLGARVVQQKSMVLLPDAPRARRRFDRFRAASKIMNLLYYRIWFSRLAPKLRIPRHSLRQTWIRTQL